MEKNLSFFEAWRAKRREKKNEELERLSAVKVEGGVLAKYLKLRSQELEEGLNGIGTSKEKELEVESIADRRAAQSIADKKEVPAVSDKKEPLSTADRKDAQSIANRKEVPSVSDSKKIPPTAYKKEAPVIAERKQAPLTSENKEPLPTADGKEAPSIADKKETSLTPDRRDAQFIAEKDVSSVSDLKKTLTTAHKKEASSIADRKEVSSTVERREAPLTCDKKEPLSTAIKRETPPMADLKESPSTAERRETPFTTDKMAVSSINDKKGALGTADHKNASPVADGKEVLSIADKREVLKVEAVGRTFQASESVSSSLLSVSTIQNDPQRTEKVATGEKVSEETLKPGKLLLKDQKENPKIISGSSVLSGKKLSEETSTQKIMKKKTVSTVKVSKISKSESSEKQQKMADVSFENKNSPEKPETKKDIKTEKGVSSETGSDLLKAEKDTRNGRKSSGTTGKTELRETVGAAGSVITGKSGTQQEKLMAGTFVAQQEEAKAKKAEVQREKEKTGKSVVQQEEVKASKHEAQQEEIRTGNSVEQQEDGKTKKPGQLAESKTKFIVQQEKAKTGNSLAQQEEVKTKKPDGHPEEAKTKSANQQEEAKTGKSVAQQQRTITLNPAARQEEPKTRKSEALQEEAKTRESVAQQEGAITKNPGAQQEELNGKKPDAQQEEAKAKKAEVQEEGAKTGKSELQEKPLKKTTEAIKKSKPKFVSAENSKEKFQKDCRTTNLQSKSSKPNDSLRREVVQEAVRFQEKLTFLTERANEICCDSDRSEASCVSQTTGSESLSLRKDPKKLEKKIKPKPGPDECYPKSQKLLTSKPMNAFEQTKLEESRLEAVVSPSKVEAFLRDTLSPPTFTGDKEPVKTMEAVVEGILTSTSDKSRHEKPSKVRYTSRGEVICGVVSIKPTKEEDDLSAITLVPAFRPETSAVDRTSDYFSDSPQPPQQQPQPPPRESSSPLSDFSDDSYDHYIASVDYSFDSSRRRSFRSSSTPRRIFPQVARPSLYRPDRTKEESPVVFDAGLTFDIGSRRTSLRHRFKPQPAFTDVKTSSSSLSIRISDFLKRTDHIMEEWKRLGKGGDDLQDLVQVPSSNSSKSKSATNIMIRGLLNYSKASRTPSLRSRSLARTSEGTDRTISDIDELSEMTLDLSEERATGTMQAERLEAETAERVRLEQELAQVQSEKKNLQQTSERLEMELFYARADVNGLSESEADLEDGGGDAALYKNKCERAMRELEFTRRRLQQQHEDDLEQLVALKKQLEKKLADAYEEVEEQRQVAAQWKRKVQKLQSEMNDLRLLLEEQSSRNNLLEKKQRKFDSEIQMLQEELRSEKNQKERASREREMAVAEKYSLEQNLSSVRLELELKEEKVSALSRELEELSCGGGSEQEVTQLRKAKHELEIKLKEQEEELDELAGQVSMLEGNKLRLEMSLESLRKEHRREMAQRDDELDEVRANGQKKIKVLESQLESEHEERTLLVREKHELERRLADAEERGRHHRAADEDALQRARRDLKKTKALLRDAQLMLERVKQDSPSKAALRALKNQVEDVELARASAVKAKQSLEVELNEVTGQLEEALRAKADAENKCQSAVREMNSLRTQVDENEEELAELLKKYRQTVQQLSAEQLANQETAGALAEAEAERASLRDQLAELTARLEANSTVDPITGLAQKKLEIRIKELESRLELEQTTRGRLEVQITRLKENVERLNEECVQARTKEQAATDLTRKLQRSLREAKEELTAQQAKDQEGAHRRKELEKRLEAAEAEAATARTDLRLAVKRIEDLQSAISGEIGSDSERTESDEEDSENDSLVSHVPSTISSASRTSRTPELTPR